LIDAASADMLCVPDSVAAAALDGILGSTTEIALVLTGESSGVHLNYVNGNSCATQLSDTLYVYGAAVDENVYFNSTSDGYDWGPDQDSDDWRQDQNRTLCGRRRKSLSGRFAQRYWVNSNPPSGNWTQLAINGNAFQTNAGLCSFQTFSPDCPSCPVQGQIAINDVDLFAKGVTEGDVQYNW
jgi:hypothetical protein